MVYIEFSSEGFVNVSLYRTSNLLCKFLITIATPRGGFLIVSTWNCGRSVTYTVDSSTPSLMKKHAMLKSKSNATLDP